MTTTEILNAISKLELQTLSVEDLILIRSALSLKLSEADWIINGRKHLKNQLSPDKK